MGGGAERNNGHPALVSSDEMLHGLIGPSAEAQGHDDDVCGVEGFRSRQRVRVGWVDRTVRIEGEEHGRLESVTLTQYFRQHGQRFFAAIFFIAGQEHDVFALRGGTASWL